MADPAPDQVYSDEFRMMIGPFGAALTFAVTRPLPAPPGTPPPIETAVVVRTSLEHLKAVAFVIHRQVARYQSEFKVQVDVPDKVLDALGTTREEWAKFWGESHGHDHRG